MFAPHVPLDGVHDVWATLQYSTFPTPILFCKSADVKLYLPKKLLSCGASNPGPGVAQVGALPLHYVSFLVEEMKFFYL
jgi:hypothetical protein